MDVAKRVIASYGMCMLLMTVCILRLYVVSQGEVMAQASVQQSTFVLEAGQVRGSIYDRRFRPLVGEGIRTVSAVVPAPENASLLLEQAEASGRAALLTLLENGRPFLWEGELDPAPGVTVFRLPVRYRPDSPAPHVVGYLDGTGEQGVAGIEAAYDGLLQSYGARCAVRCQVDAADHALAGETMVTGEGTQGLGGVVLTLDRDIQRAAEQALAAGGCSRGAVVVMDIWSGELRAMASLPGFDPNDVAAVLEDENSPLLDRTLCAYNVGSTFKLAVAAAALEMGITPDLDYNCPGYVWVEDRLFRCHDPAGHGSIGMEEAIRRSCNVYFIKLARELGARPVLEMAEALGFGRSTRLAEGIRGAAGTLPGAEELTAGELANFSFGQGKLTATPLQVAVMVSALANGGSTVVPRLVRGATDDGRTLSAPPQVYAATRAMSPKTAASLCQMMVAVVEEGSGTRAAPAVGGAGGKTASAQTGTFDQAGEEVVHAWFSGFYPAQSPRWAIVVLCEGGESGGEAAAPVFRRVADAIGELGYVSKGSIP